LKKKPTKSTEAQAKGKPYASGHESAQEGRETKTDQKQQKMGVKEIDRSIPIRRRHRPTPRHAAKKKRNIADECQTKRKRNGRRLSSLGNMITIWNPPWHERRSSRTVRCLKVPGGTVKSLAKRDKAPEASLSQ